MVSNGALDSLEPSYNTSYTRAPEPFHEIAPTPGSGAGAGACFFGQSGARGGVKGFSEASAKFVPAPQPWFLRIPIGVKGSGQKADLTS